MKDTFQKEHLLWNKVLFMIFTIIVYLIGKNIPLFMVDEAAYASEAISAEELLLQAIRGDRYQYSVFALGISPYMTSSILVQLFLALKSSEARARISPGKINRITIGVTLALSVLLAVNHLPKLHFKEYGNLYAVVLFVVLLEMIAGAMLIIWLSARNKKYGVGGQSALILINLFDSFYHNLKGHTLDEMAVALLLTFMAVAVMAIFENTEKRIPLQRVSIHNVYADKNYQAIKMNPIGVMPAMFAMAVFSLMQVIVDTLGLLLDGNTTYLWWKENMILTKPLGILMYVVGLYVLSIGFARVFINPKEMTEQFLKSGDSIVNIHAGKDTRRYLSKCINRIAFFSATMMAICLAFPLVLKMQGQLEETLAVLPSSAMMLTGIVCTMIREFVAVHHLEGYKPFI